MTFGEVDVIPKGGTLNIVRCVVTVEVEAGFSDRDDLVVIEKLVDALPRFVVP